MDGLLLFMLMIIGNMCLYWVLFGQKKFEKQFKVKEDRELPEKGKGVEELISIKEV